MRRVSEYIRTGATIISAVAVVGSGIFRLLTDGRNVLKNHFSFVEPANQYYAEVDSEYIRSIINNEGSTNQFSDESGHMLFDDDFDYTIPVGPQNPVEKIDGSLEQTNPPESPNKESEQPAEEVPAEPTVDDESGDEDEGGDAEEEPSKEEEVGTVYEPDEDLKDDSKENSGVDAPEEPANDPAPAEEPKPVETPKPAEEPKPVETPKPAETPKPQENLPAHINDIPSYYDESYRNIYKNSKVSMVNLNYSPATAREVKEAELIEYVVGKLGIKAGMPTVDVLWKIHSYIIDNYRYAYDDNHDWPIEMLQSDRGGCNAAAEVFKLLTRRCGIESNLLLMYSNNGSDSHVSNLVKVSDGTGSIYVVVDSTHSRGYRDKHHMFCQSLYGAMSKYAYGQYSYVDFYICDYRDMAFGDRTLYSGYTFNKSNGTYSTKQLATESFINAFNSMVFKKEESVFPSQMVLNHVGEKYAVDAQGEKTIIYDLSTQSGQDAIREGGEDAFDIIDLGSGPSKI